ncbi:unnamed protein product, partial [Cladocopium goreaui]
MLVTYKPDSPIRSFRLTQRVISDSLISSGRLIRPDSPVTRGLQLVHRMTSRRIRPSAT